MIEFQLIDDTEDVEVNLIDNTDNIEVELIKEIDSYNQLKDQPSINNVTLTGNKTLHDLGIQQEGDYAINSEVEASLAQKVDKISGKGLSTNDYTTPEKNKLASLENYDDTEVRQLIDTKQPRGNYLIEETDPTVPNHVKTITQNNIANWDNKQEQLISGTNIKTINNTSILGSGNIEIEGGGSDYPDITNKPKINNVELNGNKTSSDLGLQPAGNYALKSEIPDVSNFITNAVDDLANYYKKSETFTKQEVNNLISAITTMDIQVVQTLPVQDISTTTIYLVPKTTTEQNDAYDEYIYVSNAWEHIGSTEVDLTNYVTNTDYASNNTGGVIKTNTNYGTSVDSNGSLRGTTKTYADYDSMHNLGLISKVTLENVIEGKGLVSNTDYATFTKPGLIKPSSGVGTDIVSSTGVFYASTLDYATYNSANNGAFVGKGTLENVITGKNLATKSDMPKYYYGTSATAAATRAKVVECEGFVLEEGATISVMFTYAQTYNGYPYLNVNNTGNVAVLYKGGSAGIRYMWSAGEIIDFTYDGEYWVCHGRALATTTYYGITKLSNSAISTSTSLALTPAVINAVAENMITGYDAYSASKTYEVGDRVRYSSYSYECITAIPTAEAWTSAHWKAIDPLQTQIDALEARIKALENS